MSIRQLQQLGKAREQTQPAKQKKPVDFDDFDLGDWDKDADDFSDGEDQKYGLKAERNYGGKANQPKFDVDDEDERGFGGFGDEDDEDNDSFGLDDQEVDPSDLDDDFGAQKYGDPTKKRNPSAPKKVSRPEFSDDDDDFGAKDAGNIKLDDDTPPPEVLKPPARGKGPQLSESEDAIDFDLGAAVKEAKVEAERIKLREKENQDAEKNRLDQLMKAKDDSRRKGRDFSKEDALGDLADRIDKSLQLPKEPQNTSGIKAKDDSAGGMSDYLKGFLGEMSATSPLTGPIGKVKSGNEFGGMLDNSIDDAIGAENPNFDDKKSFEEFDVEKKFADLEDSDPIPAGRPLAKDGGARSNSNADQLDLLKDLNSRVNGSKDVSSNPFDRAEQHSDPEQAIMLDDNEANQNIDDEDESADKNLDNFLAEQEQSKEDPQRNNFLVDLSKDLPTKKPNSKEQKNPTKPPIKTTATKSIGFDSSLNSISKGSNRGGVIGGVTGGGTQTKRTGGGSESKLPVPSSRTFHGHPKMSHVGKARIVREDSEVDKIVGLLRAELDQKEVEIVKLETQLESALNQRTDVERTCSDLRKDKVKLEVERTDVINRLDLVMKQIANLELDKKVLQSDNTQKARLLKERQEMTERGFVNSALENQKRIYEAEIESRNLKIDMLQNQIAALTDKVKLIQTAKLSQSKGFSNQEDVAVGRQAGSTSLRQNNNMFPLVDGTVTDLKQQILELQRKLDKRNGFLDRQGRPEVHQDSLGGSNNAMDTRGDLGHKIPSSHNEEVLSMLVKGLARENERVIKECNRLKKEGTKQRTQTDTMGSKDLVGKDFEHLETIKRLQDELLKKDEYFKNQLANFQDKAMRTDKAEAECAEFKKQLVEATNTKDVLEDKVKMLEDKLQRREQALNEAREERDVSETKLREAVRNQDDLKIRLWELEQGAKPQESFTAFDQNRFTGQGDPLKTNFGFSSAENPSAFATKFGQPNEQAFMTNKIAAQTHPEVMTIRDEQETKVRESLLQKDPDFNFEFLRKIVKPILQRLPKGDPYQKANDLIDSSILLYAKGLDTEVMEALTQLKKLLPSLDERVESQLKMEQLATETIAACAEHQTEIVKNNLVELEREFVNGVGKFLPVYLNSQKRLTLETSSGDQMLQQRQELAKLKQDNERLKREVQTTQDHNRTLEKLVAQSGRGEQDMQVALLEKKLAILEQNQRTKALEINTGLKRLGGQDDEESKLRRERDALVAALKTKNREIKGFREELDRLMGVLSALKENRRV